MDVEYARQFRDEPEQCRSKTARRTESGISHGFQTQADDSRTARRLRTLRAYRARRVCLGGSYAFDSGRTACRNPALCHFHRFHAPSGSIHVPSHRPRPRLMALRPPVRSLRRPPGSVSPSAAGLQQSPATAPEQGSDNVSDKTIRSGPNAQLVATEQERAAESAATEHEAPAKPAKRKSGRSAVPSWDEILFGD